MLCYQQQKFDPEFDQKNGATHFLHLEKMQHSLELLLVQSHNLELDFGV